jgi:glycosyltransferase involved in cell wall biosynthesis
MKLALVVCTRNKAGQLGVMLGRLGQIKYGSTWEVVVVDNGSTDDTGITLRRHQATYPAWAQAVESESTISRQAERSHDIMRK